MELGLATFADLGAGVSPQQRMAQLVEEAVLAEWLAADGATVEAGDPLAEVMVDKVSLELEAPASGVLEHRVPSGGPVGLGTTVAVIH